MSRYDDGELSKMDMGPLWAEIMESQEPFALFSGHDSTVFPLMASLGEKVWNATDFPAYATMMIIEVRTLMMNLQNELLVPLSHFICFFLVVLVSRSY